MNKVKKILICVLSLVGLCFLFLPTFTLNAEENSSVAVSESLEVQESDSSANVFEQKIYTYQDDTGSLEITLINEKECHAILVYEGETVEGTTTYSIENNTLTLYDPDKIFEPVKFELVEETLTLIPIEDEYVETEDENIVFEDIIAELEEKIAFYKDLVENETFRTIVEAIITFFVILIARLIENKSFKKATESLKISNQQNAVAKAAMENKQKEDLKAIEDFKNQALTAINEAIENIKKENVNSKDVAKIVSVGFNTINAAILKLLQEGESLKNELKSLKEEFNQLKDKKGAD